MPEATFHAIFLDREVRVSGPPRWCIRQSGKDYELASFDLVLYWPVSFQERRVHLNAAASVRKEFVQRTWSVFEQALLHSLPAHKQLNSYFAAIAAANKVIALDVALKNNIPMPLSLVSNDPAAVRGWIRSGESWVIKAITDTNRVSARAQIFPSRLERKVPDTALGVVPQMFQAEVVAEKELRVYFICGQVLLFEAARDHAHHRIDIRLQSPDVSQWHPVRNPKVERLTRRLANLFGLRFFSADFLRPAGREPQFLDLNPHASWHWMNPEAAELVDQAFAEGLQLLYRQREKSR
jgi:hypothetical protein